MRRTPVKAMAVLVALRLVATAATDDARRDHLAWMDRTLPAVASWSEWQKRTGALPPDFAALPSANFLPDPFVFHDGRAVTMPADWPARRTEIQALFERHVVGRIPPKPKLDRATITEEARGPGYVTQTVRLEYGPGGRASTTVTLTRPEGGGPHPVLIGGASWMGSLIRRGYAVVSFSGSVDQVSGLAELYPEHDFSSMAQRAWTAQLVVDYLLTVPQLDRARIAIYGYSREGKMATLAAALDPRIAAVVAGSTGVGGVLPWRLAGERGMGEGVESTTRMFPLWFAPQLRFFSGREDRLPVDANLLVALVAPRACLMEYGLTDEVSNVWACEQTYHSAARVYAALGQPQRLGLLRVPGFHGANDPERCIDWLDIQFGRSARTWTNDLLFPWDFEAWRRAQPGAVAASVPPRTESTVPTSVAELDRRNEALKRAVKWVLGEVPPAGPAPAGRGAFIPRGPVSTAIKPLANPGQLAPDVPAWVIARNSQEFGWLEPPKQAVDSRRIRFGAGLTADLYFPAGRAADARLPAVVWLHGYSYPLGYMWVYRRDLHPILALVKAGFVVLAYDQCGFGSRMAELGPFYDRYPRWSQLGRLVEDARLAIDALQKESLVDGRRIGVFGYTLGGTVGLHAAALDPRIAAVVAVSGFTSLRSDTAERPTGGLARLSRERPLAPRLGWFIGRESEVPYDYDALLGSIAPRAALIVQPRLDRDATPADVRTAVAAARAAYALRQAEGRIALHEPDDYQRLPTATQDAAVAWLAAQLSAAHDPQR